MLRDNERSQEVHTNNQHGAPNLNISKLGIVSRDYRHTYQNGFRDFGHVLTDVLNLLDREGCDAVLFSLYGIDSSSPISPYDSFAELEKTRAVFLEEYTDGEDRKPHKNTVYYRTQREWTKYSFTQAFASIGKLSKSKVELFVSEEVPKRVFGNCCILLCGETNGVKYSRKRKTVEDTFGLRNAIPSKVEVILNPIHDLMTRPEMKWKRQFLSEKSRWTVSVWNKGKIFKDGRTRDGVKPPWTVYHNGDDVTDKITRLENDFRLEIGVLDTSLS